LANQLFRDFGIFVDPCFPETFKGESGPQFDIFCCNRQGFIIPAQLDQNGCQIQTPNLNFMRKVEFYDSFGSGNSFILTFSSVGIGSPSVKKFEN